MSNYETLKIVSEVVIAEQKYSVEVQKSPGGKLQAVIWEKYQKEDGTWGYRAPKFGQVKLTFGNDVNGIKALGQALIAAGDELDKQAKALAAPAPNAPAPATDIQALAALLLQNPGMLNQLTSAIQTQQAPAKNAKGSGKGKK